MATGIANIFRTTTNGPFMYTWDASPSTPGIDTAAVNVATLNAALDAIKPLANGLPGTIQHIEITVTSV